MLAARLRSVPAEIIPPTVSDSAAPVRVSCSLPALELLAFRVTMPVPPVAESKMVMSLAAVAVIDVALVLETEAAPLPPLTVSAAVLRSPPVDDTPVLPSSTIDVAAVSPAVLRLILAAVDLRLMLLAVILPSPVSVIAADDVTETSPVPAAVAFVAAPSDTAPLPAVRNTLLTPVIVAPAF